MSMTHEEAMDRLNDVADYLNMLNGNTNPERQAILDSRLEAINIATESIRTCIKLNNSNKAYAPLKDQLMTMTNERALEVLAAMELDINAMFPKVTNAERSESVERVKALSVARMAITKSIADAEADNYDAKLNTIKGCTEEIALCNTGIHRLAKLMYGCTDTILYYKYDREKAAYLIRHYKAINAKAALLSREMVDDGLPRMM